jgi:hypothetical protein
MEILEIFLDWTGYFIEENTWWIKHSKCFDSGNILFYYNFGISTRMKQPFRTTIVKYIRKDNTLDGTQ